MKKLLLLLLIAPCFLQAQYLSQYEYSPIYTQSAPSNTIYTVYDTTILFQGIDTIEHEHEWLSEWIHPVGFITTESFKKERDIICNICLKNFKVKERVVDKFHEAKNRLKELTSGRMIIIGGLGGDPTSQIIFTHPQDTLYTYHPITLGWRNTIPVGKPAIKKKAKKN